MRIDDVITESINPDILNPDFQHRQEIDGLVYTAESKVYFNKLDTLKIRCYNHENEEIASVLFEVKQGKWLQAVQVVVEPEYRGEGLANTMYAYAKMLGNTIKPSGTQTDQGKAMWAKWGADARHLTHEDSKPIGETELSEAFDQPYAIQWIKTNGDWHATADLDDGSELIVLFMSQGDNQWMVEFERDENMDITGEGDAPRVFATVLMAMRQFIAKRKPAMLNFSAEKEDDPTGSRARLYDRMIQRYITGTGYNLTRQDYPGGATYTMTQIQKPVKQPKQEPAVAEDQINELGNAPAEYKSNRKRKNSLFHATVEGHWVDVFFDRSEFNGTLHITFTVNGNYDTPSMPTSASKSTVKILSTVLNVVKQRLPEYIKKSRPPGISFTAKEDNRAGLYRKYFVPVIQDILGAKWAHEEYPNMGMTVFHWRPVRKTMGEELNEISDRLLQNYLSRSDRQISRRLDRMSQARERLNKNYEIYNVNNPARVIDRFEANTPAQAEEYYYKFIKEYNPGDENFEFGLRRSTGITEAFDQPRGIDWEQSEESEAVDAIARLSDGTALTVMFEPEAWTNDSPTDWSVSFWRGNSQEVTGAGNAQEVFATVMSAIRQFVHAHNPESIEFSASKDPQVDMAPYGTNVNPESRAKLYDRMVNRYASAMGYQVQQQQGNDKVTYTLRQLKKSLSEDQDYMAGHCHVMAIALKMLHPDWQIRAHVGWEDDEANDDEYRVDHVYIVASDGSAYDCRGRFDSEEALVGEDVTGGFETQYADLDLADIQQLVQRGELKRFTREDINKAVAFAKRIQQ
jgi:hypothetical protein